MPDFIRGSEPIDHLPLPIEMQNFSTQEQQETFFLKKEEELGVPIRRPWEIVGKWVDRKKEFKPVRVVKQRDHDMAPERARIEYRRLLRTVKNMKPADTNTDFGRKVIAELNEYAVLCDDDEAFPIIESKTIEKISEAAAKVELALKEFTAVSEWKKRVTVIEKITSAQLLHEIGAVDGHQAVRNAAITRLALLKRGK